METIELATLLEPPERINHGNVTPTWKGAVLSESGETVAYLKVMPPHELLAEAICALVGRASKLPIPKPFLLQIPDGMLPDPDAAGATLAFALEDAGHPSLKQWISDLHDPTVAEALLRWPPVRRLAAFDEWIANGDRNQGNLLYDGSGDFVLIDHGRAFDGPDWHLRPLDPSISVENQIARLLLHIYADLEGLRLKHVAQEESQRYADIDLAALPAAAATHRYIDIRVTSAVLEFLAKRAERMGALMVYRAGIPELQL